MQTTNTPQKGQYYSLSAYGIPKRCRKEQSYYLKGPFILEEKITPQIEQDIIMILKAKMIGEMRTVKQAYIKKNPATLDNGIMSHLISFGADNVIWKSEAI